MDHSQRTENKVDPSLGENPGSPIAPPVIKENADMFRLLVETVKDYAIFLLDPQGYVMTWNQGAERLKGYAAHEIIGRHFSTFYEEDAVQRRHPDHELELATRDGRYEEEGWRIRKDGSMFWANVVITALFDEERNLRGFAKVTRDMTERKRAEEELRASYDLLEKRVEERTAELSRANQILLAEVERRQRLEDTLRQQAEQLKNEAEYKDEFLAMLAHELRNPMGALSNALHVLFLSSPGAPAFERSREVAMRQMAHQNRLVDDLLDVSRIRRGKIELNWESLDLVQLAREVLEDHRPSLEAASVTPLLEVPKGSVTVQGDRTRLTQVVSNLLDNARKFTPPKGQITLQVSIDSEAQRATLAVRDTGIGINPRQFTRLFEPFAQADRSLDRSLGGLGLGLALVKGLTELHGGTVSVQSEGEGRGAEFTVTLPFSPRSTDCGGAEQKDSSGPMRVLVIEDNRDAAETMRDLLEIFGYRVDLAFDGREGLSKAQELCPDVVLCDIGLPEVDGYSVAAEFRRNPVSQNIPLVAITGYGKEEDRRHSMQAGFRAHLTKPINPTDLQQLLERIVREEG